MSLGKKMCEYEPDNKPSVSKYIYAKMIGDTVKYKGYSGEETIMHADAFLTLFGNQEVVWE